MVRDQDVVWAWRTLERTKIAIYSMLTLFGPLEATTCFRDVG